MPGMAPDAGAGPGVPAVRSAEALGLVRAAVDLAGADGGGGVAAGVVDGAGELVAFLRSDGAPLRAVRIAVMKAYTAARFGRDTAAVARTLQASGRALAEYGDPNFTALPGGVPLVNGGGRTVGGLGVSGRTPEDDHELAVTAVAAVAGCRGDSATGSSGAGGAGSSSTGGAGGGGRSLRSGRRPPPDPVVTP